LWLSIWRSVPVRRPDRRAAVLSWAGPSIALSTVALWAVLMVFGFGSIYLPFLDDFTGIATEDSTNWIEATYYSGYVASTLGLGDVVPTTGAMRLLTVVEAIGGFSFFAVATTYLLSVYRQAGIEIALAMEISDLTNPEVPMSQQSSALARWGPTGTGRLLSVVQSHAQYPVLHYFRPASLDQSLLIQVGALIEVLSIKGPPELAHDDPPESFLPIRCAVRRYLTGLNEGCLRDWSSKAGGELGQPSFRDQHNRLRAYMGYS
jgi:hypothetical protein